MPDPRQQDHSLGEGGLMFGKYMFGKYMLYVITFDFSPY